MRSSLHLGGHDGGEPAATHQPDAVLARRARAGDSDSFGLLYLRHHHAIWRMAHGVSGFAPQCPDIAVAAFAGVFGRRAPDVQTNGSCRPALFAEVRRLARGATPAQTAPELVVTDGAEQPVAVGSPVLVEGFRRLAEPHRTAWWLLEVERFTPREAAAVMVLTCGDVVDKHAAAGQRLAAHLAGVMLATAAPGCLPTAERIVKAAEAEELTDRHIRCCPVCRMRQEERQRPAVTLCDAVPPMPLLGLECHRRWRAG